MVAPSSGLSFYPFFTCKYLVINLFIFKFDVSDILSGKAITATIKRIKKRRNCEVDNYLHRIELTALEGLY